MRAYLDTGRLEIYDRMHPLQVSFTEDIPMSGPSNWVSWRLGLYTLVLVVVVLLGFAGSVCMTRFAAEQR